MRCVSLMPLRMWSSVTSCRPARLVMKPAQPNTGDVLESLWSFEMGASASPTSSMWAMSTATPYKPRETQRPTPREVRARVRGLALCEDEATVTGRDSVPFVGGGQRVLGAPGGIGRGPIKGPGPRRRGGIRRRRGPGARWPAPRWSGRRPVPRSSPAPR